MVAILGHRGASAHAIENTLDAFVLALDRGADGVELDVQLSADGEVVVFHDELLDRLAVGVSGGVGERPWSALETVELRGGAAIPRLADVLGALPERAIVNIEIKSFGEAETDRRLCAAVAEVVGRRSHVVCSSFSVEVVETLIALGLPEPTLVVDEPSRAAVPFVRALGATGVHLSDRIVTPQLVRGLLGAGLVVGVWTVNDRRRRGVLTELGVARIITDDP